MSERTSSAALAHMPTRRRVVAGIAVALGGLVAGSSVWAENQQPGMKEVPNTAANNSRTSLHQEVDLKASSQHMYEVLLDSKLFAAFSGLPANIDPKVGGAFSMFKGMIVGRNVELVPHQRIVQAWRPTHWDPGVYSIVRFELKPRGSEVTVILDHTGFAQGEYDSLYGGWNSHYWEPLKKFLA